MKNQTDLIVAIVAFVLTAGSLLTMWLMKRETVVLAAPTEVTVSPAVLPAGDVSLANSLPAGGGTAAGMGGMGGFGGKPGLMGGMSGGGMMGGMMGGGPGMPGKMGGGMGAGAGRGPAMGKGSGGD